jgi:putative endonuclease
VPSLESHIEAGRRGEDLALDHLLAKGYALRFRNFRSGRGEIDLIMEDPKGCLVFVEVKANRSDRSGHPLERVDGRKIRRLQRLAQRFCLTHRIGDRDMRFDVVGVDLGATAGAAGPAGKAPAAVEHIENAFLPDGAGYYPSR